MKQTAQMFIHTARQIGGQVLELLLPTFCAGCGKAKAIFCDLCQESSYKLGAQCLICGFRNRNGKICHPCLKPLIEVELLSSLRHILWAGRYDGPLKEAIWQFKYKKRKELAKPLAQLLKRKFDEVSPAWRVNRQVAVEPPFVVIPVPLHFKKEYERGFNQAELLAKEFAKLSNLRCWTGVLIKQRETKAQVDVKNKELRIKNLENAFEVNVSVFSPILKKEGLEVIPTIILIDDVSTTGATLIHASRAFAKTGAKNIIGLVVAHG